MYSKYYYGDILHFTSETQPVCPQAVLGRFGIPPAGQTMTCLPPHSERIEIILLKRYIDTISLMYKGNNVNCALDMLVSVEKRLTKPGERSQIILQVSHILSFTF